MMLKNTYPGEYMTPIPTPLHVCVNNEAERQGKNGYIIIAMHTIKDWASTVSDGRLWVSY